MTNNDFLEIIRQSFKQYLTINTSRSTAKLKSLHGQIATDLQNRLGQDFSVSSQGFGDDRETSIQGRYYSKRIDIAISKNSTQIAGYSVKFVMRNYSQNSNNYFEGMLGETANIRTNDIPYFQIFIIFDKVPYYEKDGKLKNYENISQHNLQKYIALSKDNPQNFFHTPDKTLVVLLKLKENNTTTFANSQDYANYYLSVINDPDLLVYSNYIDKSCFDNSVILNDYEDFLQRSLHIILGKLKN